MGAKRVNRSDLLLEVFQGRLVGGSLSQLANYSDLFHKMSEMVFLVDPVSLRVLDFNESAGSFIGLDENEILGRNIADFFPIQSLPRYESQIQANDGSLRYVEIQKQTVKIQDYFEVLQVLVADLSETKKLLNEVHRANEILKALSSKDEMTGLPNYRTFKETLKFVHSECVAKDKSYGIIFVDVDHFKKINDTHGHPAGDAVLKQIAFVLGQCNSDQLVARYGGEEFVILVQDESLDAMNLRADKTLKLVTEIQSPVTATQPLNCLSASLGIARFPDHGKSSDEILKAADLAVYQAKTNGRKQVVLFDPKMNDQKKAA